MRIRSSLWPASLAIAVLSLAGCNEDQADVKGLSRYTPEILVEETLARYKAVVKLSRGGDEAKGSSKADGKGKAAGAGADDDKIKAAVAKYGDEVRLRDAAEASKASPVVNIFEGVVRKVPLIEDASADQVYAKLDEAIDHDQELTSAEKDAFKSGVAEARKKGPSTKK